MRRWVGAGKNRRFQWFELLSCFYFGLDREGFISSHTFDRKVPTMGNKRPLLAGAAQYPWLQSSSAQGEWTPDLLVGALSTSVSRPTRTLSGAAERDDWEDMCLQ